MADIHLILILETFLLHDIINENWIFVLRIIIYESS